MMCTLAGEVGARKSAIRRVGRARFQDSLPWALWNFARQTGSKLVQDPQKASQASYINIRCEGYQNWGVVSSQAYLSGIVKS